MINADFTLTIRSSGFCLCKATNDFDGGTMYENVLELDVSMRLFDQSSPGYCSLSIFVKAHR